MATLGTFVAGQVLTAAELNAIGTWTDWTPTWTSSSGTLTTVATYEAKYSVINDIVFGRISWKITNVGTGSGQLRFTVPVTAAVASGAADGGTGVGRENQLNGNTINLILAAGGTFFAMSYYNNAAVVAVNMGGGAIFTYRAA